MAIIHTYGTWSIEKAEGNWLPENLIYHSREFVDWIEFGRMKLWWILAGMSCALVAAEKNTKSVVCPKMS